MAALLKEAGYRTASFGKWHLGTVTDHAPNAHGFEEFYGFLAGCVDYYSRIFYWDRSIDPVHDLWHNGKEVWNDGADHGEDDGVYPEAGRRSSVLRLCGVNAPHYPMHARRYI
ncbi:MAG TPA: sulfatase-like hydrolase/transferase [Paenibacillus sp.]|nr:sulfatase-like hydrolase/transferase [Paenibacillus sp.]